LSDKTTAAHLTGDSGAYRLGKWFVPSIICFIERTGETHGTRVGMLDARLRYGHS
jgi:hypothetical protein